MGCMLGSEIGFGLLVDTIPLVIKKVAGEKRELTHLRKGGNKKPGNPRALFEK
jgi:hypothetical protein